MGDSQQAPGADVASPTFSDPQSASNGPVTWRQVVPARTGATLVPDLSLAWPQSPAQVLSPKTGSTLKEGMVPAPTEAALRPLEPSADVAPVGGGPAVVPAPGGVPAVGGEPAVATLLGVAPVGGEPAAAAALGGTMIGNPFAGPSAAPAEPVDQQIVGDAPLQPQAMGVPRDSRAPESNRLARRSSFPPPAIVDGEAWLGGYHVLGRLRADAAGSEYLCCPMEEPAARFVLKVLRCRLSDEASNEAFLRFANRLAKLSHPGVLGVLDAGISQQQPYLVRPYFDAMTLAELLAATPSESRPVGAVLRIFGDVLEGIAAAHQQRQLGGEMVYFVHGALSADHVLVRPDGRTLVAGVGESTVLGPVAQDPGQDLWALRLLLNSALPWGVDENELRLRWFNDGRKGSAARAAEWFRELREMTFHTWSNTRPERVAAWVQSVRRAPREPSTASLPPDAAAPAANPVVPRRSGVFKALRAWLKRRSSGRG